jgi:hypothetical protein
MTAIQTIQQLRASPAGDTIVEQAQFERARDRRNSRLFIHAGFIACLILQRFGYANATSALFISLPIFVAMLGFALVTGLARLHVRGAGFYMAFAGWALVITLLGLVAPDARFGLSLPSLAATLVTYAGLTLGPSERFERRLVFPTFLSYARFLAGAGIVQWVVQFAGLRFFSFLVAVPALRPVLVETQFNFNPILHYGSTIMRSNGLLLLEPSVFSQVLAIAVVVDYFIMGRAKWLPLYLIAYLLSFSGTGALSLLLVVPFYAMLSRRNFGQVAAFGLLGIVALIVGMAAFPDQVGSVLSRTDELSYSGSSGYARFIGPFLPIADLSHEARFLIGWGPGATDRYIYHYAGTGNSIAKLIIDYGVVGLLSFLAMFLGALWRFDIAILSMLALSTFLVGGGYLLFTPILVLLFLLCIWSDGGPLQRKPEGDRFRSA